MINLQKCNFFIRAAFLIVNCSIVKIIYFKMKLFPQKLVGLSLMIAPSKGSQTLIISRFERLSSNEISQLQMLLQIIPRDTQQRFIWLDFEASLGSCGSGLSENHEGTLISIIYLGFNNCLQDLPTVSNIQCRYSRRKALVFF